MSYSWMRAKAAVQLLRPCLYITASQKTVQIIFVKFPPTVKIFDNEDVKHAEIM